ncbi:MAG: hypothetical protein JO199_13630 [Candidatus Eremiobacteraeota bacterium]|nr:hypothetical protein [Candidatus Eremiobacteraeota bacterium]
MFKRLALSLACALAVLILAVPAGVRADSSFAGTWTFAATGDGPNADQTSHMTIALTESNGSVTGTYDGATLEGTRSGDIVTGTFKTGTFARQTGHGYFVFAISNDGKSVLGTWGVNPGTIEGEWNGTRQ